MGSWVRQTRSRWEVQVIGVLALERRAQQLWCTDPGLSVGQVLGPGVQVGEELAARLSAGFHSLDACAFDGAIPSGVKRCRLLEPERLPPPERKPRGRT